MAQSEFSADSRAPIRSSIATKRPARTIAHVANSHGNRGAFARSHEVHAVVTDQSAPPGQLEPRNTPEYIQATWGIESCCGSIFGGYQGSVQKKCASRGFNKQKERGPRERQAPTNDRAACHACKPGRLNR